MGLNTTLIDSIKQSALASNQTKFQTSEASQLETILNNAFYLPYKVEEETKFIQQVMTRGFETQERKGLHASSCLVSDKAYCTRRQVLSTLYRQAQGDSESVRLKRIFEHGNAVHEKWQRLFIRAGFSIAEMCDKTCYSNKYHMYYSPDIICHIPEFYDGLMVVEIKSVSQKSFSDMLKHPTAGKQLQLYMHLTGIKKGIVLSECKNTQEILVEVYCYSPIANKKYIDRANEVKRHYDNLTQNKRMVKRPHEATTPDCLKCNYCIMKDACWSVGRGKELLM